jgi:hypothetical protein
MAVTNNDSENILIKTDHNNLIYIDPNSVIVDGKVQGRNIKHEEMVMFVNLEADLIPRTVLIDKDNKKSLTSISKGTFNLMKSTTGDFDTTWTNAYNDSIDVEYVTDGYGNKIPVGFFDVKSDLTAQSFGISSININIKGGSFIPQITINFIDIRAKTLFESPQNSPYKCFFHLPWPIFYLTIKGYYGKAIRYRLHLTKFSSSFNDSNGNFEITTSFVGSTYAFLNDIPLMGILNAPFMFLSEKEGKGNFNQQTGKYEKIINKTSRGFVMLQSIYDEYKEKGYLPKDFPVRTLREVITIAASIDKILEREIFDQKVDMRIFSGIKEFQKYVEEFDEQVNNWAIKNLTNEQFVKNNLNYRILLKTNNDYLKKVKSDNINDNTLKNLIINNIDRLKKTQIFTEKLKNQTSADFKKIELTFQNEISNIDSYIENNNGIYGLCFDKLISDISKIKSSFNTQKKILQDSVEEQMNKIVKDKEKGLGFEPTIQNIFGVLMANADVYIRLLKEVHTKSFESSNERAKKIGKLSSDSVGEAIFPWPEIKKETSTKQRVLTYPGDPDIRETLGANDPILWPEVDFVENYHAIATKRLDTLADKEGGVENTEYVIPKDKTNNDIIKNSSLFQIATLKPYSSHSLVTTLYEIWERTKYLTSYDSFNVETIREMVNNEFTNIQTIIEDDIYIVDILKKLNSLDKFKDALFSYSPYEKYPYLKDELPTTEYIIDLINKPFKIEEYFGSEKNTEKDNKFNNLKSFINNYKVEPYRNHIYPFSSDIYKTYVDFNFKDSFNNNFEIKTSEGLVSSKINSKSWVKSLYVDDLFSQTLKIGNGTDSILNTPYFHKQLNSEFNKKSSYGKYVGSAYLLLNSLPFLDLHDKISFNNTDFIRLSTLLKEIGSSHYIPYHLILKWGAIYHRYKVFLNDGYDILSGFTTNNISTPISGGYFFDKNINDTYTPNDYQNGGITVNYSNKKDIGFHPIYESLFHQIVNGYGTYDTTLGSVDFNPLSIDKHINNRFRYLDNTNSKTWTSFVDNSKYKSNNDFFTFLPSDGDNEMKYLNNNDFDTNEQNNFRIIWSNNNNEVTYSGLTINSYNEYFSSINHDFEIGNDYKLVIDLIGTLGPNILDKFENYFIEFASEKINDATGFDNFKNIKYTNFQTLLKAITTVTKKSDDPTEISNLILTLKKRQKENLKNITQDIISEYNLLKITLGNPKEIDNYILGGFVNINNESTLSIDIYNSDELNSNKNFIKLYLGDDNEGEIYNKYVDFFRVNNIRINEENILLFRPIIQIYAGYIKNGEAQNSTSFKKYLVDNVISNTNEIIGLKNRHDLFLTLLTPMFGNLNSKMKDVKLSNESGFNEGLIKLELYNYFKLFNDRWASGNSIGQRPLIEEFLFLDKANKNIGNLAYLTMDRILELGNEKNIKQNLYGAISLLIQGTGFDMRALPSYINFNGTNFTNKSKKMSSKNIANNLFGTFLEVDYQDSAPKIVLQYTGPTSKILNGKDVNKESFLFNNDSFKFGDINNNSLIITLPEVISENDLSKSNKVVGFEVNIGDQNQSIFKSIKIDQTSIKNTTESYIAQENMGRSETGSATYQVDIGLFDIYRASSYTCEISCLGNVMIQPTMYFYLNNIPLFNGSYWITEVTHTMSTNTINTTFKGVRVSNNQLPDPKESFMSSYRVLFEKITNKAIARQNEINLSLVSTNEIDILTSNGTYTIDKGDPKNAIIGETILSKAGINEYGICYNGFRGEKYIQLVEYNGVEYYRATVTIMDNLTKMNDTDIMDIFNKSKLIEIDNGRNETPNVLTWNDIKSKNNKNDFYSLRFDTTISPSNEFKTMGDKILSSTITFYNPKNLTKKITITPFLTNNNNIVTVTPDNIKGPVAIGPNINGVGLSISRSLAKKLNIDEGKLIYFQIK